MESAIKTHDECAAEYDRQAYEYKWFGPEVLLGLSFEHIKPHDSLLDIGIGTGLGSLPFAKAGLKIFGIDGSVEMLKICESKGIAEELREFDLQNMPLPFSDRFFNHVISSGVFHFFDDLEPFFRDVSRIIKPGGVFAFTTKTWENNENGKDLAEDYSEMSAEGSTIFMHSNRYIERLFGEYGFEKLKDLNFFMQGREESSELLFTAYVAEVREVRSKK